MNRYHIIAQYHDGLETPIETVEAPSHRAALQPYVDALLAANCPYLAYIAEIADEQPDTIQS